MLKLSASKQITLGAMCVALTVLSLYAAAVLPTMRIACYFLSALFVYIICAEHAFLCAFLIYIASGTVCFFLIPDKTALLPYLFLLGHFGIFRTFLSMHLKDPVAGLLIRLLYCNFFFALALLLAVFVFCFDLTSMDLPVPLWSLVPILQAVFLAFDLLYAAAEKYYLTHIRNFVIPRR